MYNLELKNRKNPVLNSTWDKDFEHFFNAFTRSENFAPACEVLDQQKAYSVSLDIPGLKQDEIEIEVKENQLHISGERKPAMESEQETLLRSERRYGKFQRVFSLPQNVKTDEICASFENGVLEVSIPKEEKARPRKIQINGRGQQESVLEN